MSELLNSIWPNGIKKDAEGYSIYYPLGTNKIDIPDGSKWPKGTKLKFPFVYDENGKLTGFCDTKSMTNPDMSWKIYLPYKEIEADFSSIDKGTLSIHAPNATVKKAIWSDGTVSDIPEAQFKYKGCKTVDDIIAVDANYKSTFKNTTDNVLYDLEDGNNMFYQSTNLSNFSLELPNLKDGTAMFEKSVINSFEGTLDSLTNGTNMFYGCQKLAYFKSDLNSLINGDSMFYSCSGLEYHFRCDDLSSLENGHKMFYNCGISYFDTDMVSLIDGAYMFHDCKNLTSFNSDLKSLTNGELMFFLSGIKDFKSDLSSLESGYGMFASCADLTTIEVHNLSNLLNGNRMFHSAGIETFNINMNRLSDGREMFTGTPVNTFNGDLSSLTNGTWMFRGCGELTSFNSNLKSLTGARDMFDGCKLDASSVKNIIDTINTYSAELTLGMGCNNTTEDKNLFAQEVGYTNMSSLLTALQSKGWTVTAQYNGRPTTTYALKRPSEDTLPVFVKLEETEDYADYTSLDDTKKFRLDWFHETTGSTEGYTQFNSLEEAVEYFNIKPIERN